MVFDVVTKDRHKFHQNMSDIPLEDNKKRSRRHNPFHSRERDNYPSLDAFFGITPNGETIESVHVPPPDDGETSSVLNMSIGARAALTEHLRHVLKHGIDGEQTTQQQENDMPRNVLDEKWEAFLEKLSNGRDSSASRSGLELYSNASSCLEQSMEVMTDISHDFFNSTRVQSLLTPERNRDRIHRVSTRQDDHIDFDEEEDFLVEDDEAADTLAPELLIAHSSSSEEHRHASFQSASFCVPDISRISSADDSEPRPLHRSPNSSFQLHHNLLCLNEEQATEVGEYGINTPLMHEDLNCPDLVLDHHPHETMFASMPTPRRAHSLSKAVTTSQGPAVHHSFFEGALRPKLRTPRRSYSAPGLALRDVSQEKENQCPRSILGKDACKTNDELSSTLFLSCTAEPSFSALDTMPSHFMEAIELVAVDQPGALSPISQHGSYHVNILYESSSSSSSRHRNQTKRPVQSLPFEATIAQDVSTSSSSGSLMARKRFRTVVPRRVYMDSPSEFPNEQDSFGRSTSENSSGDQAQRSLLESFEAALDDLTNKCGSSTSYTHW